MLSTGALAQNDAWREYRREDLGFRVEFPGEPTIEEEANDKQDEEWIRSISASSDAADLTLGVAHHRYRFPVDPAVVFDAHRKSFTQTGVSADRDVEITIDGAVGREFIGTMGGLGFRTRVLVVGDAIVMATVMGDGTTPSAVNDRFIGSFRLLPSKP